MNFTWIDGLILVTMYVVIVGAARWTRTRMRSVVDYLAAGRSAGRYLLTISSGIAGLGAITVVANMEAGFESGFTLGWWGLMMALVQVVIVASGWIDYRFRRTRSLTLAEFFERRYSRRFRIFSGVVAFASGVINFGIFPAVGSRFFIYFLGLPESYRALGLTLPTFPTLMAILLLTAVYFLFAGGQVAVIVTDFIQGAFANVVFLIVALYLLKVIGWGSATEVLNNVPPGYSKINPFDTGYLADFNFTYFLIGIFGLLYSSMSWQGTQAYNSSARSAHEGKMGRVLGLWRNRSTDLFMGVVPILVYTVMHHADWAPFATDIQAQLDTIDNASVRNQMRAPLVISALLPPGLTGAFAALMLGAFISTHNTYLHSWSSIFIQDVVLPIRGKKIDAARHFRWLRWSVVGVALFIFCFSLFYRQSQAILLFFALTGAIFAGWSGAALIGGLYTRWGRTAGAWAAGIAGVTLTMGGFMLEQVRRAYLESGTAFWGLLNWTGVDRAQRGAAWVVDTLPNGQVLWGHAMWVCSLCYIVFSLLAQWLKPAKANLDRLLHRGEWALKGEIEGSGVEVTGWRAIGFTPEFSKRDRWLYSFTYGWNFLWVGFFAVMTTYFVIRGEPSTGWSADNPFWIRYWLVRIWIDAVLAVVVIIWFIWGGARDVRDLMARLGNSERDLDDDGVVEAGDDGL